MDTVTLIRVLAGIVFVIIALVLVRKRSWRSCVGTQMLQLPTLTVVDQTSGAVVGDQIRFANTALARLIGLLGATNLHPGEGLLLAPSSGVHTWGMSFPIDVIAMDRGWQVRRIWQHLPPRRILLSLSGNAHRSRITRRPGGGAASPRRRPARIHAAFLSRTF